MVGSGHPPVMLTVRKLTRDDKRAEYRRRYREKKKAEKAAAK